MGKVKKASNLTNTTLKNKTKKSEFKKKTRKEPNNKKGLKLALKNSTMKMKRPALNSPSHESVNNGLNKNKKSYKLSGESSKKNENATKKNNTLTKKATLQTQQHEENKVFNKKKQNKQQKNTVVNDVTKNNTKKLKESIRLKQNQGKNDTVKLKNETKQKKMQSPLRIKVETLQKVNEKKRKQKKNLQYKSSNTIEEQKNPINSLVKTKKLNVKRLEKMLAEQQEKQKPSKKAKKAQPQSLKERMMSKLKSSRFRYLNESLYNSQSIESKKYFKDDPDAFTAYHEGYRQQVEQWPLNPLDKIISTIAKLPKNFIVADFGCGEAKLAASIPQKVYSFDHVAVNDTVTACDMAHTPLLTNSVNIVVFCLSLMGSNLKDYIIEANRVLKKGGILKIADVESRFEKLEEFIKTLEAYGFKLTWKDLSHNLFYFMDFNKQKDISTKPNKLPTVTLKPCLYKKR